MRRRDFINFLGGAAASPFAALSAIAQSIDADPPEPTPAERMAMAEAAKAFMQQYAVPGLSVAIGHSGRLIYQDAFGWADREARDEAIPAHLFRICSISKPITSVAVFTLIEEGRLRLADKVFGQGAVLGTEYGHPPSPVDEITIEHLLTHTSGGWPNNGTDPMFHTRHSSQAELIAFALYQPLQNQPGHVFAYSNFGYCVLGRVIEKIVGQSYADFVRDSVLRRCGINDMTIGGDTLDERRSGEVRYYGQNGEDPYWTKVTRMDSCGGWIASPTDIVKFTMHVSGFAKPDNILRPETITTMTTASAQNANYARGWQVNEAKTWWHEGSLPGSNAIMVRTNAGFCWAAGANSRDKNVMNFLMRHDFLRLLRTMVGQVNAWHA